MTQTSISHEDILQATERVNALLLSKRNARGWWTGRLSTSALSTATAVMALHQAVAATKDEAQRFRWQRLADGGLNWLAKHQNIDGGWGDTVLSISNISTTMLAHAVFRVNEREMSQAGKAPAEPRVDHVAMTAARQEPRPPEVRAIAKWNHIIESSAAFIAKAGGVDAVIRRYGKDRTFSVPILTHCALAGIVEWKNVIPLPFELACVPHRLYAAVRMPVVSYAAGVDRDRASHLQTSEYWSVMRAIRRARDRTLPARAGIHPASPRRISRSDATDELCVHESARL
ncbi:MAG: hypothetical protein WKF77_29060 [Planctomycetaceae bacterium]